MSYELLYLISATAIVWWTVKHDHRYNQWSWVMPSEFLYIITGTGNVLKIQQLLHTCSEHDESKDEVRKQGNRGKLNQWGLHATQSICRTASSTSVRHTEWISKWLRVHLTPCVLIHCLPNIKASQTDEFKLIVHESHCVLTQCLSNKRRFRMMNFGWEYMSHTVSLRSICQT